MARVLIIESGDDWRALSVPDDWSTDDVDRYLNGMAYGRAAVVAVEDMATEMPAIYRMASPDAFGFTAVELTWEPDSFLPLNGGEYGGGSV